MQELEKTGQLISPIKQLEQAASMSDRRIENCFWFRPTKIDFDILKGQELSLRSKDFLNDLTYSLGQQGHEVTAFPNRGSDMIIGFHQIPSGEGSLFDRVEEIEPMAIKCLKRCNTNALQQNYTVIVELEDDIRVLGKREMEATSRMVMARLGALKIVFLHPEYWALATMEGGLGVEFKHRLGAIDRFRDRLVCHAIARTSGGYQEHKGAVTEEQWQKCDSPYYLTSAFKILGEWGVISSPFDVATVASHERAELIRRVLNWSRQSESAGALWEAMLDSGQFQMGDANGLIVATASGRYGVDKTNMDPEKDVVPVAIVPKVGRGERNNQMLTLDDFTAYALGIGERDPIGPSIEFDEMSVAFFESPLVRVSADLSGQGWRLDPKGRILLPRVRGFVHIHAGVEAILPNKFGQTEATNLIEYVPANLRDFPYPVGCGKDITFSCTTDAVRRSRGINDLLSPVQLVLKDTIDHGTDFLLLTQPLAGTNYIPANPFIVFLSLLDPNNGAVKLTAEVKMI